MDAIIDSNVKDVNEPNQQIVYGTFWLRLVALILDGLIVGLPVFAVNYFNITQWKNTALLVLISVIAVSYKPFCESMFGATIGKMAVNLKVVNLNFEKAEVSEVLLRNIFNTSFSILSLAFTVMVYNLPEFQDVTGFMEYSRLEVASKNTTYVSWANSVVVIVEFICLVSDKRSRSLHDRIAKTYVIVKNTSITN